MTDPAEIDLEHAESVATAIEKVAGVRARDGSDAELIRNLIAAVEALREQVAVERAIVNMHKTAEDRAVRLNEAAEARVVELEQQHDQDMADALQNGRDTKRAWDLKAAAEAINRDMAAELEWIAHEAGQLADGAEDACHHAQFLTVVEQRARAALKTKETSK